MQFLKNTAAYQTKGFVQEGIKMSEITCFKGGFTIL